MRWRGKEGGSLAWSWWPPCAWWRAGDTGPWPNAPGAVRPASSSSSPPVSVPLICHRYEKCKMEGFLFMMNHAQFHFCHYNCMYFIHIDKFWHLLMKTGKIYSNNQTYIYQALSVQCSSVNFTMLTSALRDFAREMVIDLVYVNNTAINNLQDSFFKVCVCVFACACMCVFKCVYYACSIFCALLLFHVHTYFGMFCCWLWTSVFVSLPFLWTIICTLF